MVRSCVRNLIALQRARAELAGHAGQDDVSGLADRHRFERVLEAECRRLRRSAGAISVIRVRLDEGLADEAVRDVAAILAGAVGRAQDVVARYGGAEFVALLPETDVAGAMTIGRRMLAGIEALGIGLTANFGVAGVTCDAATAGDDVMALAGANLVRAQGASENRIVAGEPVLT